MLSILLLLLNLHSQETKLTGNDIRQPFIINASSSSQYVIAIDTNNNSNDGYVVSITTNGFINYNMEAYIPTRKLNINYFNDKKRVLFFTVYGRTASNNSIISCFIGKTTSDMFRISYAQQPATDYRINMTCIVPPNYYYRVSVDYGGYNIDGWIEFY